jgi:hypothetical protein
MPNEYITTEVDLKKVANSIRAKGGTSAPLVYPDGFVNAVNAIPTGGSDIPVPVPVNMGGTGATDAETARANLGIPNVAPVAKGGTGASNAAQARQNLGITPGNIGAVPSANVGTPGGVAGLNLNGKVLPKQMWGSVSEVTGATETYTLSDSDVNKLVRCKTNVALAVSIPTGLDGDAWPIGAPVFIERASSTEVVITGATGVTINAPNGKRIHQANNVVTLMRVGTNEWVIYNNDSVGPNIYSGVASPDSMAALLTVGDIYLYFREG